MDFISQFNMLSQMSLKGQAIVLVLLVWSLAWKGVALWRAAHRNEKKWFVALLIINTVGILEILYLYVFSKREGGGEASQQ